MQVVGAAGSTRLEERSARDDVGVPRLDQAGAAARCREHHGVPARERRQQRDDRLDVVAGLEQHEPWGRAERDPALVHASGEDGIREGLHPGPVEPPQRDRVAERPQPPDEGDAVLGQDRGRHTAG